MFFISNKKTIIYLIVKITICYKKHNKITYFQSIKNLINKTRCNLNFTNHLKKVIPTGKV